MPKVKKDLRYRKKYSEEQMQDALSAAHNGMTKRAAARQYSIPRATLIFRLNSEFVKTTNGPDPALGIDGEKDLVEWLMKCSNRGFPRRRENIQVTVKEYLGYNEKKNPFTNNTPGDKWYKSFLRRHPILSERFAEGVTGTSSNISESGLRTWFEDIHRYLSEENHLDILEDPTRIYNYYETYFNVCPEMKHVLAVRRPRNVYAIDR